MHSPKEHAQPTPYKPHGTIKTFLWPSASHVGMPTQMLKQSMSTWTKLKNSVEGTSLHILSSPQAQPPFSTPYKHAVWTYGCRATRASHVLFDQGLFNLFIFKTLSWKSNCICEKVYLYNPRFYRVSFRFLVISLVW